MRSPAHAVGCLMLLLVVGTQSFLSPQPALLRCGGARRAIQRPPGLRMMADGKEEGSEEDKLKAIEKRIDGMDLSDKEAWAAKMKQVEEMKAKEQEALPKVGGKASAPSGKEEEGISFLTSSQKKSAEAEKVAKAVEEEKREIARASIEDMEIDPRGFVVPKVGDIVLCPGKWANEDMVGLVEATQFVDTRMSWNVDVIELTQVAPQTYGKTYSAWKKPVKTWFDVSEVRPASASYDEKEDGWVVQNVRDLYSNPVSVNETRREEALVEYAELKMKILKDTAILGVGISGALATVDQGVAVSFAMGSVASLAYLQLLTKQVDDFGPGGLGFLSPRLLAPIGLFVALYIKWATQTPDAVVGSFPALPGREIAAAAIGFLAYKVPLLYESSKQIADSLDDAGEGLEQGVAMGYKEWQKKTKQNIDDARERERNPETTLNPFTKIRLVVTKKIEEDAQEKLAEMKEEKDKGSKE